MSEIGTSPIDQNSLRASFFPDRLHCYAGENLQFEVVSEKTISESYYRLGDFIRDAESGQFFFEGSTDRILADKNTMEAYRMLPNISEDLRILGQATWLSPEKFLEKYEIETIPGGNTNHSDFPLGSTPYESLNLPREIIEMACLNNIENNIGWFKPGVDPSFEYTPYLSQVLVRNPDTGFLDVSWQLRQVGLDSIISTTEKSDQNVYSFSWNDTQGLANSIESVLNGDEEGLLTIRALSGDAVLSDYRESKKYSEKHDRVLKKIIPGKYRPKTGTLRKLIKEDTGIPWALVYNADGVPYQNSKNETKTRTMGASIYVYYSSYSSKTDQNASYKSLAKILDKENLGCLVRVKTTSKNWIKIFYTVDKNLFKEAFPFFDYNIPGKTKSYTEWSERWNKATFEWLDPTTEQWKEI